MRSAVRMVAAAALLFSPVVAHAQRTVPAAGAARRAVPSDTVPDSLRRPPISPRRAMLLSLLVPGAAQARLRRPHAAMLFAAFEVISLGMARKSAMDLREAKAAGGDSVPTGYAIDPATGAAIPTGYTQNRLAPRVSARHAHYEDWLAALIFNHIIAAADAYVAANLWDFKANVSIDPGARVTSVRASVPF